VAVTERDVTAMRRQMLDLLGEVVPFDAHIWLLTDPVTGVGTAPHAVVPCLPELPALVKAQYLTGLNRWTTPGATATSLNAITGGDLGRSHAWQAVKSRYGVVDVLSTQLRDAFGLWGFLELWRVAPSPAFSPAEVDVLTALQPALTTAVRQSQAATFRPDAETQRQDAGPVVLTLDDDLRILSRTAASQAWLDLLLPPDLGASSVPASVYNVAAQLLALEQGVDDNPAYSRTHLRDGLWLTLRAARIEAAEQDHIVVTLQEASSADRLEVYTRAVGLTSRETDVLLRLASGGSTRSIAAGLQVSEHTVQDHFKSIFAKTGARDRVSVLARALGTPSGAKPSSGNGTMVR
jgi:DNA-binding CsgD family transcriptional regulator